MLRLDVLDWRHDDRFINHDTGETCSTDANAVDLLALLTARSVSVACDDPVLGMALQLGAAVRQVLPDGRSDCTAYERQ